MPTETTTATPTPTATAAIAVLSFTLIDADTDQPVAGYDPILNNATIDIATLPTSNINIRANTDPAVVGSVWFVLNAQGGSTDNNVPYAFAGETNGNYRAWNYTLGTQSLTATPYSGPGKSGTAGTPFTLDFTLIDSNTPLIVLTAHYFLQPTRPTGQPPTALVTPTATATRPLRPIGATPDATAVPTRRPDANPTTTPATFATAVPLPTAGPLPRPTTTPTPAPEPTGMPTAVASPTALPTDQPTPPLDLPPAPPAADTPLLALQRTLRCLLFGCAS